MKSSAVQSGQMATKMKWFNWQGSGAGWFKTFLFTLALFIVPLAIVLSAVELAFRYVNRSNAVEIPDYTENSTYIPLRVKGNYQGVVGGIPITTNSHGFRDEPEFDPTPPAGEFRILSMGDSIAFGLTLDSSDTYAKVLERHLNERCCMDRGGDGIRPFPSGSVRRCVRTQAARVRSLCSELSGRPGSP